jgi:hypothetical protein
MAFHFIIDTSIWRMCKRMPLVAFGLIPWRLFLTGVRVPEWLKRRRSTASNKAAPPRKSSFCHADH